MANFIVSYDLNGSLPTHQQMDHHIRSLGPAFVCDRVLETVWYLGGPTHTVPLRNYLRQILRPEDRLLVVEARNAAWQNLLVPDAAVKYEIERQPLAA